MNTPSPIPSRRRRKYRSDRVAIKRARIRQDKALSTLNPDVLLSTDEAAAYLDISAKTLARWRCEEPGKLPYIKIGRKCKYRVSDLEAFIWNGRVTDGAGVQS